MSRNLYIQVITCRKYIRVDIFVLLLLISSFSSLLPYNVFFVTFLSVTTSLFEGEFFVCNTLNRCIYTQHIYSYHLFLVTVQQTRNLI